VLAEGRLMMKEPEAADAKSKTGESAETTPKPTEPREINIVVNWSEELKQRIPVKQ
jgi:hypothetical protein